MAFTIAQILDFLASDVIDQGDTKPAKICRNKFQNRRP